MRNLYHIQNYSMLWGKHKSKKGTLLTYQVKDKNLEKVPTWKVIIKKYFPLLLMVVFGLSYNFYWDINSLVGFGLGGLLYLFIYSPFWIFSKFKISPIWSFIFSAINFILVGMYIYYGFKLDSIYGFNTGFSSIMDYSIQSMILVFLLHVLYANIANKGYKNYYYSDTSKWTYKIKRKSEKNLNKKFGLFATTIVSVCFLALIFALPAFQKSLLIKIEHVKQHNTVIQKKLNQSVK